MWALSQCELVLDIVGGHFCEDALTERFRVFDTLRGVEDFDVGEAAGRVVVDDDAVFEVFRGHGCFCEEDVGASASVS